MILRFVIYISLFILTGSLLAKEPKDKLINELFIILKIEKEVEQDIERARTAGTFLAHRTDDFGIDMYGSEKLFNELKEEYKANIRNYFSKYSTEELMVVLEFYKSEKGRWFLELSDRHKKFLKDENFKTLKRFERKLERSSGL